MIRFVLKLTLVAFLALFLVPVNCPGSNDQATDILASDDGWRRTADGWEAWPLQSVPPSIPLPVPHVGPPTSAPFPGSAHPALWAGFQLSLSLLSLASLGKSED